MGHDNPPHLTVRRRKQHRQGFGRLAICGRADCDMYHANTLPDSKITCPDCLVILEKRTKDEHDR